MKNIQLVPLLLALFFVTLAFTPVAISQHDGFQMPSHADSLIYQESFNYPDSLKMRQNDFSLPWAFDLGIEEIFLLDQYRAVVKKDSIDLFKPNQTVETFHKSDYILKLYSLDFVYETPADEDGYIIRKNGARTLNQDFYAFLHGTEVWILHRDALANGDTPSAVVGYVWKNGTRPRTLTTNELGRVIFVAKQVDILAEKK